MTTTCTTVFNLNDSQSLELDSSTEMESKGATPTSSKGKRQLPSVPVLGSPMHACLKTVTFNSELRKASVGGTESVGEIRPESLSVSLNFDSTDGNSGTCSKIQIKSPSKSSKENTDPNEVFLFPENDVEGSDLKSEISNFSKSSTPLVHICEKKITCQRNGKDNWSVSEETRCKNVKTPNKTPTIKTPLRTPATDGKFKVASGNLSARSNKSFTTPGNTDSFSTPAKEPRRVTIEGTPIPCPDFLEGELPSPSVMRTPVLTPSRRYTLDDRIIKTPECYSTVQMDLNGYDVLYGRDRLADGEDSSSVTVAVRVRPFMPRELLEEKVPRCIVSMNGNETTVTTDSGVVHQFTYDFSFWSVDANHGKYDGQENVYKMLAQPLLGKAFEGYNTCLFAYGQTGSGKSYSIMGHGNEIGIIPRFCEELFSRAEVTRDSDENVFKRTGVNINVEISFFEIYNEKIHDLLASSKEKGGKKPTLRVREHPVLGPYVEGLSTYVTNSFEDVQGWINLGNKNRATAATGMNDKSSRSHSVFTLVLTQTRTDEIEGQEHEHSITSKINLVDLAGSERQSLAQTSGQRLREGANINKSLLTLGKVISALSEQNPNVARKKKLFIPYRDSVLTWLLKESLGGNSKTAMIATISPSIHHIEETLSTLRYANQARTIVNLARVNEDPKAKIIRELRDEIDRLKSQSMYMSDDVHTASLMEIATLREKLLSKEKEMEEMTRSWQHRFKQSEQRKVEEAKMLEKAGITFKVDNKLPNLVNLNEDPQLSDLLLYVIKEGQTRVGRMCAGSGHEIQLNGALIADDHCIINNEGSLVSITPIGDAQTYVNGNLISEPVILHHGDRVIVGGDHYFRFNHPHEVRNKATSGSQEMKDFDFARQELLQVQEARLQHELEEARKKAQEEVEKARREAEEELNSQKTGYEEKLVELEKTLKDQTLEALKALQSRQEAEDTIQQLKQQKMILEQEVVAGRRRQEIEAKAAQKVSLMYGEKSKLLILLETERKKVQQRIQEMKQRKSETASPCRRYQSAENQLPGKTDLYKVALLIREANKIGQFLKKNMEFSREDYMEEESTKTLIKVTDTKLSVCTYWTVPKFEEKLMQMRDMYQNETDGVGDDQVFHDPGDNWEYDEKSSPLRSPKGRVSFMRSNSRSFLSSVSSSIDSPFKIQGDRTSPTDVAVVDQETQTNSTAPMAALCRGILLDDLEKYNAYYFEESVADKVLHMCEMLVRDVQKLADGSHAHRVTFAGLDISQDMQSTCVQVLNQVQLLTSQCAVWSSSVSQGRSKSSATTDIFLKLQELVKAMRSHIVLLFQGFENGLDGLVQEACNNVKDSASSICRLAGELSLVTSTPVLSLDEEADEGETIHLSPFVSQSFLAGCDTQVDRHLQKSIKALEECEERMQKLVETAANNLDLGEIPQNVSILICTCKLLLSICQEVQVEVDSSMRESLDLFPGQYYSLGYQRLQGMMGNVDKLMESISLLMQNIQPVVDGKERDLRKLCRCAELIQKGAARLLESATRDVKNYQDTTCSSFTDLSVLTDTQTEQLEFATQDINLAANSLIANAMKIVEHENFSVTPRKRMLPASPNKSVIGSPYSPMKTTPSSKS